ncbi:MAG: AsnC family transcriptional regulator, partial [Candidatus Heimdallarchaeota archaeon]|nr:AsnC family transcriptional regulator [Candidatus Heimdallarchaeota archaeon]
MFDEIDLKLLYLLKLDARMSLTKMGKELSLSVPAITYRLNRLVNKKVITNFTI